MKNIQKLRLKVRATDYSSHCIKIKNPEPQDKVIYGELIPVLEELIQKNKTEYVEIFIAFVKEKISRSCIAYVMK